MAVTVKQVTCKKDLRAFVDFPNKLYKGNQYFVPKLFLDEYNTFNPKKNPCYKFSEASLYLAYKDGRLAGRVAAIINHKANEIWNHKEVRYGWIDFIEDVEVAGALMKAVEEFGRSKGMEIISGPLGFTDFDPEGMLIAGYDPLCTMALIYNYPYYPEVMEKLGYTKEIDWVEYKVYVPEVMPEKIIKVSEIVTQRYGFSIRKLTKKEVIKEGLGYELFQVINETYKNLYNFTPLTDDMVDKYIKDYLGILDFEYVTVVMDPEGKMAAYGIAVPSIRIALQKSRGRLLPFGWFRILKSLYFKHEECIELLLVGVKPEYRSKGLMALIFSDLIPRMRRGHFVYGETNAELETNTTVQQQWGMFKTEQKKRRRIYTKKL